MELRRYKDIFAMKEGNEAPLAFHARNLEVATLSEEAWEQLSSIALIENHVPSEDLRGEAGQDLESWNLWDAPDVTSDPSTFGIRNITLNVTQICNLHCTYCAAGGDGTYGDPVAQISIEKTLPQLRFFLDQIPPGESLHVAFLGGEPLMYPLTIQALAQHLFDEAEKRNVQVSFKVTTNGTLINDRVLNVLRGMNAHVTVSLDGPAEVNDRQRLTKSGQGSFALAFDGLVQLLAFKKDLASVGVHAVFNEKNLELEKAWDLFSQLPVDYIEFTYSVNEPKPEITKAYNEALERVLKKAWDRGGIDELRRLLSIREIFDRLDEQRQRPNHCGMGKNFVVIDAKNRLWTCPWKVGSREDQIGSGVDLDYDRLKKYQKTQVEMNQCESCWARFLCGGGCSFIHGSTQGITVQKKIDFCERTRFLIAYALMYYAKGQATSMEEGL